MTVPFAVGRQQFLRYLLVGGLNTAVSAAVIFIEQAAHAGPVLANIIGYGIGVAASFTINSKFTFQVKADRRAAARFLLVVVIAYLGNLATVLAVLPLTRAPYVAQLCG